MLSKVKFFFTIPGHRGQGAGGQVEGGLGVGGQGKGGLGVKGQGE